MTVEHRPTAAVLTVSDAGSRGERLDTAGPAAAEILSGVGFAVVASAMVPDEPEQIAAQLLRWADEDDCALVITAGGTGLSPRDRTPEATATVLDYRVDGIQEAIRAASVPTVPTAMLSRALAGVRGRTLIVNLSGSERAVREQLAVILPVLGHAVSLLRGDTTHGGTPPGATT